MPPDQIRFTDGAAYERYMGEWSRLVAGGFLDWLSPEPGLRWLDVGCGNGAFTEVVSKGFSPSALHGIDPAEAQLDFARKRSLPAEFHKGDAMALPFPDASFDVAVMPLVLFFVPDPAKGVAEMARVVRRGGSVTAYTWDMHNGGFPYTALRTELEALGVAVPKPPSNDASKPEEMAKLWSDAGLEAVEQRVIEVTRAFAGFEEYWDIVLGGPSVGPKLRELAPNDKERLKARLKARLPADRAGRIAYPARANAVKGRVKG